MIFDDLIEELPFLSPTNITENAYISDIENTLSFIELLAIPVTYLFTVLFNTVLQDIQAHA